MEPKNFQLVFEGANPVAIDLLEKMLEIDPDKRITAEHTLAHPYLAQVNLHFPSPRHMSLCCSTLTLQTNPTRPRTIKPLRKRTSQCRSGKVGPRTK